MGPLLEAWQEQLDTTLQDMGGLGAGEAPAVRDGRCDVRMAALGAVALMAPLAKAAGVEVWLDLSQVSPLYRLDVGVTARIGGLGAVALMAPRPLTLHPTPVPR